MNVDLNNQFNLNSGIVLRQPTSQSIANMSYYLTV